MQQTKPETNISKRDAVRAFVLSYVRERSFATNIAIRAAAEQHFKRGGMTREVDMAIQHHRKAKCIVYGGPTVGWMASKTGQSAERKS